MIPPRRLPLGNGTLQTLACFLYCLVLKKLGRKTGSTSSPPSTFSQVPRANVSGHWAVGKSTKEAAFTQPSILLCPSALLPPHTTLIDTSFTYETADGIQVEIRGRKEKEYGRSNYVGVSGKAGNTPSEKQYTGLFVNRLPRSLKQARDGTTNTLLFGENRAAITWLGAEGWPVLYGLGDTPNQKKPLFTSLHPGIVMFATADGAVRALSFAIEQETLNNLAGMADGETL